MPDANVRRRGMGSPEAQVGNLRMVRYRLETCATVKDTQVENLCYEGNGQNS